MLKYKTLTSEEVKEMFPEVKGKGLLEEEFSYNPLLEENTLLKEEIKILRMQIEIYRGDE